MRWPRPLERGTPGADAVTLSPELLRAALSAPDIDHAVDDFIKDWKSVYGETRLPD